MCRVRVPMRRSVRRRNDWCIRMDLPPNRLEQAFRAWGGEAAPSAGAREARVGKGAAATRSARLFDL